MLRTADSCSRQVTGTGQTEDGKSQSQKLHIQVIVNNARRGLRRPLCWRARLGASLLVLTALPHTLQPPPSSGRLVQKT